MISRFGGPFFRALRGGKELCVELSGAQPPPRVHVRIYCQATYYRHRYVRWLITERSERDSKIPGRWELELALAMQP